jgi:hypothetical protein
MCPAVPVRHCFSNCGLRRLAGFFGRKSVVKIVADTEQMKNAPIRVCAKTAFVGDLQQKEG